MTTFATHVQAELWRSLSQELGLNPEVVSVATVLDVARSDVRRELAGKTSPAEERAEADRRQRGVLHDVRMERDRQDAKWGRQDHAPMQWLAILGEEFGEVCRAAAEAHWRGASHDHYRAELVQVAAVAVSMIECHDRQAAGEAATQAQPVGVRCPVCGKVVEDPDYWYIDTCVSCALRNAQGPA